MVPLDVLNAQIYICSQVFGVTEGEARTKALAKAVDGSGVAHVGAPRARRRFYGRREQRGTDIMLPSAGPMTVGSALGFWGPMSSTFTLGGENVGAPLGATGLHLATPCQKLLRRCRETRP